MYVLTFTKAQGTACCLGNRHTSYFRPCRPWAFQLHTLRSFGNQLPSLQEITAFVMFVLTHWTNRLYVIQLLLYLVGFIYCCCHDSGNTSKENCTVQAGGNHFTFLAHFWNTVSLERGETDPISFGVSLCFVRRHKIPRPYKEKSQEEERTGIKRKMQTQIRKHKEGETF